MQLLVVPNGRDEGVHLLPPRRVGKPAVLPSQDRSLSKRESGASGVPRCHEGCLLNCGPYFPFVTGFGSVFFTPERGSWRIIVNKRPSNSVVVLWSTPSPRPERPCWDDFAEPAALLTLPGIVNKGDSLVARQTQSSCGNECSFSWSSIATLLSARRVRYGATRWLDRGFTN